ncbi:MAG TPA: DUF4157 domain-containing protein [Streptosporangiaceae bacterium]|nr:DUF4157 domain-containing protein [Streptosporangiaceae bacterium]
MTVRQSERRQPPARSSPQSLERQTPKNHSSAQAVGSFDLSHLPVHPGEQSVPPVVHAGPHAARDQLDAVTLPSIEYYRSGLRKDPVTAGPQAPARVVAQSERTPVPVLRRCDGASCPPGTCSHDDEHALHREADSSAPAPDTAPPTVRTVLRSPGQPLDEQTRTAMEAAFGYSFSAVRIHNDSRAAASARAVRARAYTVGSDVVFGTGQYSPASLAGRELLAHEMAHVVQQRDHAEAQPDVLRVGEPGDNAEREAARAAKDVMKHSTCFGQNPPIGRVGPHVQGQFEAPMAQQGGSSDLSERQGLAEPTVPAGTTGPAAGRAGTAAPLPPKLRFWFKAFIPNTLPGAHIQSSGPFAGHQVFQGPPLPPHLNSCFETDERTFDPTFSASSRMRFMIEFDTATHAISVTSGADLTFEVDCSSGAVKCAQMPSPNMFVDVIRPLLPGSMRYDVIFRGTTHDPCVFGSPNIAIQGDLIIDLAAREVNYKPLVTLFPAIEMYADVGSGAVPCFTQGTASSVFTLFLPGVNPYFGRLAF